MINYFIKKWDKNKDKLENYFRTHNQEEYGSYSSILENIIKYVFNDGDDYTEFNYKDVEVIDYGDYQGTQILVFCKDTYQPDLGETYYTHVYYGSCSGCDTLLAIMNYDWDKKPTDEQVEDYMTLALHMVQHIKRFEEDDYE